MPTRNCCTFFVSPNEERLQERANDLLVLCWDLYNDIINKVNNFSPHVYMLSKFLSLSLPIFQSCFLSLQSFKVYGDIVNILINFKPDYYISSLSLSLSLSLFIVYGIQGLICKASSI